MNYQAIYIAQTENNAFWGWTCIAMSGANLLLAEASHDKDYFYLSFFSPEYSKQNHLLKCLNGLHRGYAFCFGFCIKQHSSKVHGFQVMSIKLYPHYSAAKSDDSELNGFTQYTETS